MRTRGVSALAAPAASGTHVGVTAAGAITLAGTGLLLLLAVVMLGRRRP